MDGIVDVICSTVLFTSATHVHTLKAVLIDGRKKFSLVVISAPMDMNLIMIHITAVPCRRTVNSQKTQVICINCDHCPGGVAHLGKWRGYCRPQGCNCNSGVALEWNIYVCLPCNCECGECKGDYGIEIECCGHCHCKCGTYRISPSFALLLAPNGFTSVKCKRCAGCFPSKSRVSLENGKSVTMAELQTGDRIQAGEQIHYSSILSF